MNPQPFAQILNRQVQKVDTYRKHWLIETTDQQKWVAKRIREPDHLHWWLSIDQELRQRGFTSMPSLYTDGQSWMITSWINGKVGTYRDPYQTISLVQTLASFHQIGNQLQTPPKSKVAFLLYDRLHHRLQRFFRLVQRSHQISGELGQLLRREGPYIYQDGVQVWQKLQQMPLYLYTRMDRQAHALSHRDLASHNWLIEKTGGIWLIDFDTADYDYQLGDVWQMFSRILAEHPDSLHVYPELLAAYESVRPLRHAEKDLLFVLLHFPNEFFRESLGLHERRPGYRASSTIPYLKRLAKIRKKQRLQMNRFPSW